MEPIPGREDRQTDSILSSCEAGCTGAKTLGWERTEGVEDQSHTACSPLGSDLIWMDMRIPTELAEEKVHPIYVCKRIA